MRETPSPFGLSFYILAWVAVGGVLFLGNTYPQNAAYLELWILVTAWVVIVAAYTRLFGETARGRRLAAPPRRKLCVGCGYDLRATGDRCPECGKDLPASKKRVEALENLAGAPIPAPQNTLAYEALMELAVTEVNDSPDAGALTETTPSTGKPPPPG